MPAHPENREGLGHADLALLAHEVRGALTVIAGFSELMRRRLSPSDRQAALDGITRAVRRIDRLMQSSLEGRLGGGFEPERLELVPLVEAVAGEQRTLSGRRIDVVAQASPAVLGVTDAVERAVANLIDNALKYSLLSAAVEVRVNTEGGMGVIEVADRGPGIPEKDRQRVFDPFERLGKRDSAGSGLGLSVVRGVADSHGGKVEVRDREGGGTIVRLELPIWV